MDDALAAQLQALERALHAPAVRGDVAQLAALLDDDFREIGSSGTCFDRAAALAEIPRERAEVEIVSCDYDVALLAPTLAQVRYRSWYVIEGVRQREVLRSSLWRLHGEAWRVVFHQGTPAAP
ncbi:MAG: nuclear transport factor 2 family protein [Stenotrophomonas sp.]|uniref:nuclear transport factor 2 family protein n=1 Tax=unclassified Stenotrophomonas TaxID=196198 RepID=UPI00320A3A02